MLLPKEDKFFDLFDRQAENLVRAAEFYRKCINEGSISPENVREMHEFEHYGDEVTHTIINTLNETFITPFDREDILALANRMDDIVDNLYLLVNRFFLYKITRPTQYSQKLAGTIEHSVRALQKAVATLRSKKHIKDTLRHCVEINRLENEGDVLRDEAISYLFANEKDPILVIKQKELYEIAEVTTDFCEHVANMVESILVKNN
ncbi:MAG: DUF47 domain-containing protein [Elusimicrobiaceae bacterium]|nr:DUF47 domain-containing protein [Elusimicrobiaceae bacterium]